MSENFSYPPEVWRRGLVQDLFVNETERGKGVGKMLMDAAVDFFFGRGVGKLHLHVIPSNPARRFYEKYGMKDGLIRMDMQIPD